MYMIYLYIAAAEKIPQLRYCLEVFLTEFMTSFYHNNASSSSIKGNPYLIKSSRSAITTITLALRCRLENPISNAMETNDKI
jgi:hypothetical protein